MNLTDEQERLLSWLHTPMPTEPVLVELEDRTLPAVKFALEHGIFAVYVMECRQCPTLEDTMSFAGLYDPKAMLLYTNSASPVLAKLPFASGQSLLTTFLEAASETFEAALRHIETNPRELGSDSEEVWTQFLATYTSTVHEAYIEGRTVGDVLHIYMGTFIEEMAPAWSRDLAAAFLGSEKAVIGDFLASLPDPVYVLGACIWSMLQSYWDHISENSAHPAHRLREIAGACEATDYEFVQVDLVNAKDGVSNSIALPKQFLPDGAFGAFDTRAWPERVREQLKATFPDTFGCFHVSAIKRARELFTGKVLFEAQPFVTVWDNALDDSSRDSQTAES